MSNSRRGRLAHGRTICGCSICGRLWDESELNFGAMFDRNEAGDLARGRCPQDDSPCYPLRRPMPKPIQG